MDGRQIVVRQLKWLLILFWAFCASICTAQQTKVPVAYTLKWTTSKNSRVPMITVVLNDGKPHKFFVDTGAPNSLVDQTAAKELNLPVQVQAFDDGVKVNYIDTRADFGPGVFSLPQVPLVLSDLRALRQANADVIGILGANLLNYFALGFNFSRQELTLIPGGKIGGTSYEPMKTHRLPLLPANEHWWVDGILDGNKIRFNVDTGAENISLEDKRLVEGLMPVKFIEGPKVGIMVELSSRSEWVDTRLLRLHKLTVGDVELPFPVVQQVPAKREKPFNSLGVDFLRRFQVMLDFPAQQMYLTPDPAYQEDPQAYVGTGAEFERTNGKILVSRVISPSPAQKAGLREGDEVRAWGRLTSMEINDVTMQIWAQAKAGTELIFTIKPLGESKLRVVTLKVEKLL